MTEVAIQDIGNGAKENTESMFYGVGVSKFIILSILTWGLFTFYWFYKNFSLYKKRFDDDSMPLARAIFSPIFAYSLFIVVNMQLEERGHKKYCQQAVLPQHTFFLIWAGGFCLTYMQYYVLS